MNLILTPQGAELLRVMHDPHPEMTEAAIVEQALAERLSARKRPHPQNGLRPRKSASGSRSWRRSPIRFRLAPVRPSPAK